MKVPNVKFNFRCNVFDINVYDPWTLLRTSMSIYTYEYLYFQTGQLIQFDVTYSMLNFTSKLKVDSMLGYFSDKCELFHFGE